MNNSDYLTFDYTQPVSELPHQFYKLYVINENYSPKLFGVYRDDKVCRIPEIVDQFYQPQFKRFIIVGWHKDGYDDPLDAADVVQETYRRMKKKEGKRK